MVDTIKIVICGCDKYIITRDQFKVVVHVTKTLVVFLGFQVNVPRNLKQYLNSIFFTINFIFCKLVTNYAYVQRVAHAVYI